MALIHIAILAAFLHPQDASKGIASARQEKKTLEGFEPIPLPKLEAPLLVEPCFMPHNPRSGLAWFTALKQRGRNEVGTFDVLGFDAGSLGLESGTRFALPTGYEKVIAHRRPRARRIPWIGRRQDWTLTVGRLPLAPLYLPPSSMSTLQQFMVRVQGSDCPPASDLDRDGIPELWFLPSSEPRYRSRSRPRPALIQAPGGQRGEADKVDEDWLDDLTSCRSVLFWDLDEDQYEDVIAMRGKDRALTYKNTSDFQLDRLDANSGLLNASNDPVRQDKLCLGPKRRDLQWALAYGAEEQPPLLLHRTNIDLDFHEFDDFSSELAELHILDARIFDFDGDAKEELLLLVQQYPQRAPAEGTRGRGGEPLIPLRHFSRLQGVSPELRLYKLSKEEPRSPELMDRGVFIPGATALCIGDLDGDGAPDLVVTRGLKLPRLFRNSMFNPRSARFYRLALRGSEEWRHAIGSYVDLYDPDTEERLARFRWPPLQRTDQPMLWLTFEFEDSYTNAGVLLTWADGQAVALEDLVRGKYRFEVRDDG